MPAAIDKMAVFGPIWSRTAARASGATCGLDRHHHQIGIDKNVLGRGVELRQTRVTGAEITRRFARVASAQL